MNDWRWSPYVYRKRWYLLGVSTLNTLTSISSPWEPQKHILLVIVGFSFVWCKRFMNLNLYRGVVFFFQMMISRVKESWYLINSLWHNVDPCTETAFLVTSAWNSLKGMPLFSYMCVWCNNFFILLGVMCRLYNTLKKPEEENGLFQCCLWEQQVRMNTV